MKVIGIIPSRYASTRFPSKPLSMIKGKTMIQRVWEQAWKSKLDAVVVATDDMRIADEVLKFGGQYVLTDPNHRSGTDRCREAMYMVGGQYDAVVNIQGDEPFIDPGQINQVIELIGRVPIPFMRNLDHDKWLQKGEFYKHIGLYAYKTETLGKVAEMQTTPLEEAESLEQLRWLENGLRIRMGITQHESISIDTQEDLEKAIQFAQNQRID